ncbi:hypothetical protein VM1G_01435 [Cytospora mali]|uniref:Involucrin repeat protein n=1 Tax=Cytospora mali TaxID=578113 RepID=A0A194VPV1_CYTMA|nr:hypothetical protein VM1G_01435 [Valsa mali]
MSDRRRRWSPESSRRRRKDRRASREQLALEEASAAGSRSMAPENNYSNTSYPYPSQAQSQIASSSFQQTPLSPDQQALPPVALRSNDDIRTTMSTTAPMPMQMPMPGPSRDYGRGRDRRRSRHGSGSSSDVSFSSSSSSSYLEISRWYPSFGRSGGVLKTFFQTPSEHRQKLRRRRSGRKKKGIFGFGNNSSSSSVNSDMAYGMGFVRKPKSRNFSPRGENGASGRETSDGRPSRLQRRQTDEEILEIGRQLAKVAREQNREDLRASGKKPVGQVVAAVNSWDRFHLQNTGGSASSSRGLPPSRSRHHDTSSSDDEDWESASEDESSSDESSGLAYGAVEFDQPPPPKSSMSRQSTLVSIRPPARKSSTIDPKLFGPVNSLRGLINTPCGFGDSNGAYAVPGISEPRRTSTAESASIEARPMQTVYPVQISDPDMIEAARSSGTIVPGQPSFSREQTYTTGRSEPVPIQAPKPIAPVPMRMYEEERIREEPSDPRERQRRNPGDSKSFVETALVTAGVAGAAILAAREKGKDKDRALEHDHYGNYGHDDIREDDTKVEDSRRAKELALEREIEKLEKVLAERNKAREQRKRDSKRSSGTEDRQETDADADRETRRRDRDSKRGEPGYNRDYDRRDEEQPETTRRVPDDAFRTRDSPLRPSSPLIIDVTPAPSPKLEVMERKSRRDSFEDEMRDARHIYEESIKSTAPISAVDMAAAIAATEHSDRYDEPERGRTNARQRDAVQEEADRYYHARRMAEREVRSRSRSTSPERSVVGKFEQDKGADIPRIVTPPEMMQKPQKNMYSEPNADFKFDHQMSPKDLVFFKPKKCPVRDPSAERPRPVLNLVIPTPVPTPSPERERKKSAAREPETVLADAPDIVLGPRGEVIEVIEATQPPDSKRVSWGPSETKQYEVESPERSRERPSGFADKPRRLGRSNTWDSIAAALADADAGASAGAALALSGDDKIDRSEPKERAEYTKSDIPSETSRSSPPRDRKVLPKGMSSRILDEEPEDAPPAPGPKPASPRNSQMPGAFADDLDFAATLAAGLQDSGFDPNIVIDDATYRRRDSPPEWNEPTEVYMQPFVETLPDLSAFVPEQGVPVREPGHVIGEVAETPASEKGPPFNDSEGASTPHGQSTSDERHAVDRDDIEAVAEPVEESPKLSKKEQRKLEKAARAAQLAEEEERAAQAVEAGDEESEAAPSSKKVKRSPKKSQRSSAGWDDADTPVNDRRVSIPADAYDDVKDAKTSSDSWEEPKGLNKPRSDSKGFDTPDDSAGRRERRREERRRAKLAGATSDTKYDDGSNGRSREDDRSVAPAPDSKKDSKSDKKSNKEEKRGGLWSLLKGSNGSDGDKESKKGNAGTLGAGAGLAGAVLGTAIAAGGLPSSSNAAEAPSEQEEPYVFVDVNQPFAQRAEDVSQQGPLLLDDPDIVPRVIKPAIDPQYGDFLPLPPSPSGQAEPVNFYVDEELPPLPDSRPATPPGQERALLRERSESSQKRPAHATHSRRRSTHETPTKSPSHTAIPIQFRMGPRTIVSTPPSIPRTPPTSHPSPAAPSQETFSSTKRHSRPPSWDRPMSWDSSREIRPLYLLERSRGGDLEHDDMPELPPLPPSRESPAPESEHHGELEAAPLIIDIATAQAAPLGSEESTPRGVKETDFDSPASAKDFEVVSPETSGSGQADSDLHNLDQEPETTPVEYQNRSSLAESSYATPFESPSDVFKTRRSVQRHESTESPSDFRDALDAPADDGDTDTGSPEKSQKGKNNSPQTPELEHAQEQEQEPEKKGYFPSVLSMLPAATLAGVDALLGRGKPEELPTDVGDHTKEMQAQGLPSETSTQTAEGGGSPKAEASEVELVSSVSSGDQGRSPPAAGPRKSPTDTPHSAIDTNDASLPNDSPAVHTHPEISLSSDEMQATEGVAHDISGADSELPSQEPQAIAATGVPPPSALPSHTVDDPFATTSPARNTEDMEPIPEAPADTVDWIAESGFENKQSVSDGSQIPVTTESSVAPLSDAQQGVPIQEEPLPKVIEESSSVVEPIATSPTLHQSDEPSQEDLGADPSTSSEAKGKQREESPYYQPKESLSENLIHEPEAMPVTFESPASPSAHSRTQSQDESIQSSGRQVTSPPTSRRLRSSRVGMSPYNSMDECMPSDAVQSGEDAPVSPRSPTGSGLRTVGRTYKKIRSLRSSRRSSMASSQGSGHGDEVAPVEGVAEQSSAAVPEQTQAEVVEGPTDRQVDVEDLEPAESATVGDSVPRQSEVSEKPISSQSEVVEEPVPSQHEIIEEPVLGRQEISEEPSATYLEDGDEQSSRQAEIVEELPSAKADEVSEGQSVIVSEPNDVSVDPVREGEVGDRSQTPNEGHSEGLIERINKFLERKAFVEKEVADVQEPNLPESSTSGVNDDSQTAREVVTEENPQEQRPLELAEPLTQRSESEQDGQNSPQQQVEVVSSTGPEEHVVEPSNDMGVEELPRDVARDDPPARRTEQASELEQPTAQLPGEEALATVREDMSELQPQESEAAPVPVEEASPFSPKKSKKNEKRRKGSTVADEPIQSSDAATPAEPETIAEATGAHAEPTSSIQEEIQPEQLLSESKDIPLDQGTQPQITNVTDLPETSQSLDPELSVEEPSESSKPLESILSSEPIVPPVHDYDYATTSIIEPQDSTSRIEAQLEEALDDDEIARREAEAALIRDETELARLQAKKKPKPKDKQRIRELKANAERRAEMADTEAASRPPSQAESLVRSIPEGAVVEPQLEEAIVGDEPEERSLPQTEEPVLAEQSSSMGPDTAVPEPEQTLAQPEVIPQAEGEIPESGITLESEGVIPPSDQVSPPAEPQPEPGKFEDSEQIARREAEASLIQEEEAEFARLNKKKNLNKKDKARLKVLKANAEQRAQEAEVSKDVEATGPSHVEGAVSENAEPEIIQDAGDVLSSQVETSPNLQADTGHATGSSRPQLEEASQPQVEEVAPSQVEDPSLHSDSPMIQPGLESTTQESPQDQPDISREAMGIPQSQLDENSQVPSEPISTTEFPQELAEHIITTPTVATSEQFVVTEPQQDSEPESPFTSKKSGKNKKKREGTDSDESGQGSGAASLTSEPSVDDPYELREPAPLPAQDSEATPVPVSSEVTVMDQGRSIMTPIEEDTVSGEVITREVAPAQPIESGALQPQDQTPFKFERSTPSPTPLEEEDFPAVISETGQISQSTEFGSPLATKEPEMDQKHERKSTVSEGSPLQALDDVEQQTTLVEPVGESEDVKPVGDRSAPFEVSSQSQWISSPAQELLPIPTTREVAPAQEEDPSILVVKDSENDRTLSGTLTPKDDVNEASSTAEPVEVQATESESTKGLGTEASQTPELEQIPTLEQKFEASGTPEPVEFPKTTTEVRTEGSSTTAHIISEPEQIVAEPEQSSRSGGKSNGWDFLAGAITGIGAAVGLSGEDNKPFQRDEQIKDATAEHDPVRDVQESENSRSQGLEFADVVEYGLKMTSKDEDPLQTNIPDLLQEHSSTDVVTAEPETDVQETNTIHDDTFEPDMSKFETDEKNSASLDLGSTNVDSSGRQTPVYEDIKQDVSEHISKDLNTASWPLDTPEDELQLPESELRPVDSDRSAPVTERGAIDQPRLEESPQPQIAEVFLASETTPKPELEGRIDESNDTLIVAGGKVPDDVSESTSVQQNLPTSAEQTSELADIDVDQPSYKNESLTPADDNNLPEALVTPVEQPFILSDESEPIHARSSSGQTEGSPLDTVDNKTHGSPRHSFEFEPEISTAMSENPLFEEALKQQPAMEPIDTEEVGEKGIEPAIQGYNETGPKELSKKERRKAKKGSVSVSEAEVTTPSAEDDRQRTIEETAQPQTISEPQDQAPADLSISSGTHEEYPSREEVSHQEEPIGETKISEKQNLERSLDVHDTPSHVPEPSVQGPQEEIAAEFSAPGATQPSNNQPMESQLQGTTVEETPLLTRKLSKKEKRKAKKAATSAGEMNVLEPNQPQTPDAEETHFQDMSTTSSPVSESSPMQRRASIQSQPAQGITEDAEVPVSEDVAEDEWAAPLSRKNSKEDKKKKGKQPASESASEPQALITEEAPMPRAAEMSHLFPEAHETRGQITEDPGEPASRVDHRSAEAYIPDPQDTLGTEHSGEYMPRNHRSAEMYSPEPQDFTPISEDASESASRVDHRAAEMYIPGAQETLGQATEDASESTSRDHRSAEVYVPVAQETLGHVAEDAGESSHRVDHRYAEMYIPEADTGVEGEVTDTAEGSWNTPQEKRGPEISLVTGSANPTTPLEDVTSTRTMQRDETSKSDTEASEAFGGTQTDSNSAYIEGRELQRTMASPDLWDNDDYFKPKADDFSQPPQDAFSRVEINPAVARGFNTSPEKRKMDHRPLVGLGLIQRHSSIFREDDGHIPRLLTMGSNKYSTESIAVQDEPSQQDTSDVMDSGSVEGDMSTSRDEPTAPALGSDKETGNTTSFTEPDSKQQFDDPPTQNFTVPNLDDRKQTTLVSTRPSHGASHETSVLKDVKGLTKKGGVAALAQKFGGTKKAHGKSKQVSKVVDEPSPREDDSFDEPAMREGTERRPTEGSRLDVDSDNIWAAPDTKLEDEQLIPDVHSGRGTSTTSHGRETQFGDDNVSETRSHHSDSDAGKFTPHVPEQATPDAEIHLEKPVVVESPAHDKQPTVDSPTSEPQPSVQLLGEPPNLDIGQLRGFPAATTDTVLDKSRGALYDLPIPRSPSPSPEKDTSLEEPAVPPVKTTDDDVLLARSSSIIDLRRSVSRGLPPVQEEPQEEETEEGRQGISFSSGAVTPEINRDSGFVTDSPIQPRFRQFEKAYQQRDSGVHMRDSPGTSPGLLSTRGFSPQPARLSPSSLEDEGAKLEDKPSRQSSPAESETQRLSREATPILEAQEPPVTPEPQKSRSTSHKKYPDLSPSPGKAAAAGVVAGGAALLANEPATSPARSGQRSISDNADQQRASPEPQRRVVSNTAMSRTRTPEPLNLRGESPSLFRHSGTPPLRSRRTRSGDLRSLSQLSNWSHTHSDLDHDQDSRASPARSGSPASAANNPVHAHTHRPTTPTPASSDLRKATTSPAIATQSNSTPVANEGRVRVKDMADVYDGFGEGRLGSPRSPTRPHSMRRRQSMQVLELEARVDQLIAENRALQEARTQAQLNTTSQATSTLAERDTEIEALKQSLEFMRKEVQRLTEVNEGLNSAIQQTAVQYDDRYRLLESQHADATRELHEHRSLRRTHDQTNQIIEEKDAEIRSLREQLEATKDHIREMQAQILAAKSADSQFLRIKDVDYFDHRCQQLCSHVQQWVLRFSKFSDMRACRLTSELNDEKIIDRLDNAVLDGSNVDHYLNDRVRRRDVFMSVTMTMIWEFVFTRYLFGMDREQRQKLKALEKLLLEVGPPQAVRQWRAVTLTLLSKREHFRDQRDQDTEAVVQAIFQTLSMILPPPSNLEDQIQNQLRKVMREAVDLSIEMRTQRAEYMMLPPLQPEYDANGDLAEPHPFNAALMNERSPGSDRTADALEAEGAIVRVVLFPLVVKKGDDDGVGDDEIVVCPAQVIVSRPRSKSRQSFRAPSSDAGGASLLGRGGSPSTGCSRSNVSMRDVEGMEGAI